jgi:hypothetical protein
MVGPTNSRTAQHSLHVEIGAGAWSPPGSLPVRALKTSIKHQNVAPLASAQILEHAQPKPFNDWWDLRIKSRFCPPLLLCSTVWWSQIARSFFPSVRIHRAAP